jgi:hypothetical protein
MAWIFRARERAQMNGTPPEAKTEYSRGHQGSDAHSEAPGSGQTGGHSSPASSSRETSGRGLRGAVVAVALAGALLLIVAEFTTLYTVHTASGPLPGHSTSTGSHNDYALIPIALLVVLLAYGFYVAGSRPALLAIGFMGVLALLIALLGDLPDAHATGLVGGGSTHFVTATAKPSAGFFMETAGALLLLVACVCGFLLVGAPARTVRSDATEEPGGRGLEGDDSPGPDGGPSGRKRDRSPGREEGETGPTGERGLSGS